MGHQFANISATPQVFENKSHNNLFPIEQHVSPFEPFKSDRGGAANQSLYTEAHFVNADIFVVDRVTI